MYDLEKADKIFYDMQQVDPNFSKKLILKFREVMPEQYAEVMHLARWGAHIVSQDLYDKGLQYICNNQKEPIQVWSVDEINNVAKKYIKIEEEPFTELDLALMTNILKGDVYPIVKEPEKVLLIAIEFLSDADFPEYDASERAYHWVMCHIKKEKKEMEKEFEY